MLTPQQYAQKVNRTALLMANLASDLSQSPELWEQVEPLVVAGLLETLQAELKQLIDSDDSDLMLARVEYREDRLR